MNPYRSKKSNKSNTKTFEDLTDFHDLKTAPNEQQIYLYPSL